MQVSYQNTMFHIIAVINSIIIVIQRRFNDFENRIINRDVVETWWHTLFIRERPQPRQ